MNLQELTKYIERKQNQSFSGIPILISGWKDVMGSVNKGDYVCITSGTAGGKTSLTLDKYVLDAIEFVNKNKQIDLRIDFFSLEETKLRTELRLLSRFLYTTQGVSLGIRDFQNSDNSKKALPFISKLQSTQSLVDTFNNHCFIHEDCKTPSQIDERLEQCVKKFPPGEDKYHLVVIDNCKFLERENGQTIKQCIDTVCLNVLMKYRNKYEVIPIVVIHQNSGSEIAQRDWKQVVVLESIRPSENSLSDSNDVRTPVTTMIGIFNPYKHGLLEYKGYDLTVFKHDFRVLCHLKGMNFLKVVYA